MPMRKTQEQEKPIDEALIIEIQQSWFT
jgi:hypothetical protein